RRGVDPPGLQARTSPAVKSSLAASPPGEPRLMVNDSAYQVSEMLSALICVSTGIHLPRSGRAAPPPVMRPASLSGQLFHRLFVRAWLAATSQITCNASNVKVDQFGVLALNAMSTESAEIASASNDSASNPASALKRRLPWNWNWV